jgi:hypothetical protein
MADHGPLCTRRGRPLQIAARSLIAAVLVALPPLAAESLAAEQPARAILLIIDGLRWPEAGTKDELIEHNRRVVAGLRKTGQ